MPVTRSGVFSYCVTNANFIHPRCKRGRVEGSRGMQQKIPIKKLRQAHGSE